MVVARIAELRRQTHRWRLASRIPGRARAGRVRPRPLPGLRPPGRPAGPLLAVPLLSVRGPRSRPLTLMEAAMQPLPTPRRRPRDPTVPTAPDTQAAARAPSGHPDRPAHPIGTPARLPSQGTSACAPTPAPPGAFPIAATRPPGAGIDTVTCDREESHERHRPGSPTVARAGPRPGPGPRRPRPHPQRLPARYRRPRRRGALEPPAGPPARRPPAGCSAWLCHTLNLPLGAAPATPPRSQAAGSTPTAGRRSTGCSAPCCR
jgi:hypothetical protein